MPVFLNPLLLWGLAAITVPILIHLLMRQRPKPRAWGAMQWLLAALNMAQRRYKLTNLLLLLLRCLILCLLVLALARPTLHLLGPGSRLILVVDVTASMGRRGDGEGSLDTLRRQLHALSADAGSQQRSVQLVLVANEVVALHDGTWKEMLEALDKVTCSNVPGGLDTLVTAGENPGAIFGNVASHELAGTHVVLISDFRQDDGAKLAALLTPQVGSLRRWQVGQDGANAMVLGVRQEDDLVPGRSCSTILEMTGHCTGAKLAVDDGIPVPMEFTAIKVLDDGVSRARVMLPPLDVGRHEVHLVLDDPGLQYDNAFTFPLRIQQHDECLVVRNTKTYLGGVFWTAKSSFDTRQIQAAELPTTPLPADGLLVLRALPPGAASIADWVAKGGVLWTSLDLLQRHQDLLAMIPDLRVAGDPVAGGPVHCDQADLAGTFDGAVVDLLTPLVSGSTYETLLSAGDLPIIIAVRHGHGWVIVETTDVENNKSLTLSGGFPDWVRRTGRRFIQRRRQPELRQAGDQADTTQVLRRGGQEVTVEAGKPLLVANGLWEHVRDDGDVADLIVTPNRLEGRLRGIHSDDLVTDPAAAFPEERGTDWSWWILLLLLITLLGEGLLASWAGRTYGR